MKRASQPTTVSRRQFLATAGSLTFVVTAGALTPGFLKASGHKVAEGDHQITAWVRLSADGKITIYNPAAEMGQGSMTALAAIIAEEMDADWKDVRIEPSPVIPEVYGLQWSGSMGGPMITAGSRTIKGYYRHMRQAGAQARYILLYNAARKWGVPVSELGTEPGFVVNAAEGQRMSYGEIAALAEVPDPLPVIAPKDLKKPEQFRLIGKVIPRFDIPEKVKGSATFGIDVRVPGMVYGAINRSPVNGAQPESLLNEQDIRALPGVIDIVRMDHGIGVVAETFEQALKAKRQMQISWGRGGKAEGYDSVAAFDEYHRMVQDDGPKGRVVLKEGDADAALRAAHKTYDLEYRNDYLCHAQMEPLNAVVAVSADGKGVEAWAGTQAPDADRDAIAEVLEIDRSQVTFHNCYLGGGFGRRQMEFSREAALLAKQVKRPVKLIWTREDDFQYGTFRPISLQRMQAGVDQQGNLTGWRHHLAGPDGRLQAGGVPMAYYELPNQYVELRLADPGVRTTYWRSVGHGPNKFAQEAFLNEIAHDLKADPYEYRRRLMQNRPRHLALLGKVAQMSNWGSPVPEGRSRGLAFGDYGGSYAAGVVEISLNRQNGWIRVHRVWVAADAGVVVQPDNATAQLEGGVIMGISSVLLESVTFKDGQVQQSNYDDYPILRMMDAPQSIEVHLMPSAEPPTSLGELSLPLMGGAIAGAFLSLTGKPLRHMPFTKEKVLGVLGA